MSDGREHRAAHAAGGRAREGDRGRPLHGGSACARAAPRPASALSPSARSDRPPGQRGGAGGARRGGGAAGRGPAGGRAAGPPPIAVQEVKEAKPRNTASVVRFARGDVAQGFRDAEVVVEETVRTSRIYQAYMEPHATVAVPDAITGGGAIYTPTHGMF